MSAEKENQYVILVCMSASPSSRHVISAASRLLQIPGSAGIALYVGPAAPSMDNAVLMENISYARECGFDFQPIQSNDIAMSIAEYANRVHARELFVGSTPPSAFFRTKKPLSEQLTALLDDVNIHVIPDAMSSEVPDMQTKQSAGDVLRDSVRVILTMSAATLVSLWFYFSRYSNANIITIYILAVLISSLITSRRRYGILAAVLYILLFNFLFIEPRFTLLVYDSTYLMTYLVSLLAALITSSLGAQAQSIARRSAENAWQARVLLDTSNQLERARDISEITAVTCRQLVRLLNRTVIFYPDENEENPEIYQAGNRALDSEQLAKEKEAVLWTKANRHHSGAFTARWGDFSCRYFSVHTDTSDSGVIGIDMNGRPFSEYEASILIAIIHEFAMALENEKMRTDRRQAEIAAENERMRSALLRSISHDLRTPLTAIYGNALNLSANADAMSRQDRQEIYDDITGNSTWLVRQMENILSMTRLEADPDISMGVENVEDVILESIEHVRTISDRTIAVELPDEPLFANMNAQLIKLVMDNLLNNAMKYTPEETRITVSAEKKDGMICVSVKDEGKGIADADKEHIFDLFYTGSKPSPDASRSMGIGLNLCQLIMKAHGTAIEVSDNVPHGAVFCFSLKPEEVAYE